MKTTTLIITLLISLLANAQTDLQEWKKSGLLPESNREHQFDYSPLPAQSFTSFEQAAQWADVVALVQVFNTDYKTTRKLNAEGQAFLDVRVPYKGVKKGQLLIVNAKGFDDNACYYPDRKGEGQRYLVFLKESKNKDEYQGFKPFCQLQVLLTEQGKYALKYPLDASQIQIDQNLIEEINYQDPHAIIDATDWTGVKREQHQKQQMSKLIESEDLFQKYYHLKYRKGIMIQHIRKLMNIPVKKRISSNQI